MAQINITTTNEEQSNILEVLAKIKDRTIAVSEIAHLANLNQNRVRYVIADLVEAGKINRIPTKAFNAHYIRYRYEVIK